MSGISYILAANYDESTWKILKFDWKTPGFLFFQKSGNPAYNPKL